MKPFHLILERTWGETFLDALGMSLIESPPEQLGLPRMVLAQILVAVLLSSE